MKHGAQVNAAYVGRHRETALHWAASSDDIAALDVLLDGGADLEAMGGVIGGGTPLTDPVAFARGADLNWVGYDGRSPLDAGSRHGFEELVKWLRDSGGKTASELK